MTTTNGNRKILDLKRWEYVTTAPVATQAGAFIASSRQYKQQQLYVRSNTEAYLYNPSDDGFVQITSPALAGTFGGGAAGVAGSFSTGTTVGAFTLTATGGTTTTLVTNQTLARDLRGYSIQLVGGPGAGDTRVIASNTIGSNATVTVTSAFSSSPTVSTTYRLITPVWYVVGAGTLASGSFKKYDYATNTWTTLTQTGLPATIGTDGKLLTTPSWIDSNYLNFASGTATAGAATTLTDSTKNWTASQWINYQVRIISGTGAGQIRTITANTATALTVATWGTNPSTDSVYAIQGNDDNIYYMGNAGTAVYKYSITSNGSWTTLTARGSAPGGGLSAHWIYGATDSAWTSENAIINGRRIYSFRGGAGAFLDYYDIPSNAWTAAVTYSPGVETFTTGSKYNYIGNYLYITKDVTNRLFRYNLVTQEMDGWTSLLYTQGAAIVGDTLFDIEYTDGATEIQYVYFLLNTSTALLRQMVI